MLEPRGVPLSSAALCEASRFQVDEHGVGAQRPLRVLARGRPTEAEACGGGRAAALSSGDRREVGAQPGEAAQGRGGGGRLPGCAAAGGAETQGPSGRPPLLPSGPSVWFTALQHEATV